MSQRTVRQESQPYNSRQTAPTVVEIPPTFRIPAGTAILFYASVSHLLYCFFKKCCFDVLFECFPCSPGTAILAVGVVVVHLAGQWAGGASLIS